MTEFILIENELGTKVTLGNVGASIFDILTKDKKGDLESIIYTPKSKEDFIKERSYLGKTIGRTGGRVSDSKFTLNGKEYRIPSNDKNGLHGGFDGISYKEFDFIKKDKDDYTEVKFSYLSKDLESGYPGDANIIVDYKLYKKENKLSVVYEANSNEDTLMNLSNHTYFNLSGNSKNDILNH